MCDRVIELMREGCSLCEISADLDISRDTVTEWRKSNEEFSAALKRGELLSQSWWEKEGRENLKNKDFATALWFINMKNRFPSDWRDKQEVVHGGEMRMHELMSSVVSRTVGPPCEREKLHSEGNELIIN